MAVATQNHIHLSKTLGDVTGNVATSKWVVLFDGWEFRPEVFISVERTFGGQLRAYSAKNSGGTRLLAENWSFRVRISAEFTETALQRKARLLAMIGETVYMHPNEHDESAHGTGYKTMLLAEIGDWSAQDPALLIQYATLTLQDINP
jgi:hypothetical protein